MNPVWREDPLTIKRLLASRKDGNPPEQCEQEQQNEQDLDDSLSSIESVSSWMKTPQHVWMGRHPPQTPPRSPPIVEPQCTDIPQGSWFTSPTHVLPLQSPHKQNRMLPSNLLLSPSQRHQSARREMISPAFRLSPEPTTPFTPSASLSTPGNSYAASAAMSQDVYPAAVANKSPGGLPPRPPLLKKRSRRGILRSTRTTGSSRRSLLSSSHSSSRSISSQSRTPTNSTTGGRRRSRSFRRKKRQSPFQVKKRVSFQLPDDSSVESIGNDSLLLCDVDVNGGTNAAYDEDSWRDGDHFGNQSCRIVLPFMDGLDSDDDFALQDEGLPNNLTEWFSSSGEISCNFGDWEDEEEEEEDSFRDDDVEQNFLSEGSPTPSDGATCEVEYGLTASCQSVEPSSAHTKKKVFEVRTPNCSSLPVCPLLDDIHKTPVTSNPSGDLDPEDGPGLPALTPIATKEDETKVPSTKESPTSVIELEETRPTNDDSIVLSNDNVIDNEDSYDLEACTARFASVQLDTDDIAVRDKDPSTGKTPLDSIDIDVLSWVVTPSISTGGPAASTPFRVQQLNMSPGSVSFAGRFSPGHAVRSSPLARTLSAASPISCMRIFQPGRAVY